MVFSGDKFMAIYHCSVKVGSKADGKSGGAKSTYITRTEKYSKDHDEVFASWSGNMPSWAHESLTDYWKSADIYERKNGLLYREVEIALPIELTAQENEALTKDFVESITAEKSLPHTVAIHKGKGVNPHAHILISERMNDGHSRTPATWFKRASNKGKPAESGGARKADLGKSRKVWLEATRKVWEDIANVHLERAGQTERIDHRSYEEQGIDKIPSVHLGPNVVEMEAKGIETDRADRHFAVVLDNQELDKLKAEQEVIDERIREDQESQRLARLARVERDDRTNGTGHGEVERRSEAEYQRDGSKQSETSGVVEREPEPSSYSSEKIYRRPKPSSCSNRNSVRISSKSAETDRLDDMGNSSIGGLPTFDSSATRISDLARLGHVYARERENDIGSLPQMMRDKTLQAVRRQLEAMGCKQYQIGIRDAVSGQMMHREWSVAEVEKNVAWLKRMNAQGNDIYIRPGTLETDLVLVDDVDGVTIEQMEEDGCKPALVTETSPENYQAWVKVTRPQPVSVRKEMAKGLATKYDADQNSADGQHYGRLAGFTNQKEKYKRHDRSPYVLCRQSSGKGAVIAPTLETWAIEKLESNRIKQEKQDRKLAILSTNCYQKRPKSLEAYRQEAQKLYQNAKGEDLSRIDWLVASKMLDRGYKPELIKKAILEASPEIIERKTGHVEDYVNRTVDKAVIQHSKISELERVSDCDKNNGMEM